QIKHYNYSLIFIPLDLRYIKLFIFIDRSFTNNKDLSSQLRFLIILAKEYNTRTLHNF
ncbi:hypothetical protein P154DRAFT_428988, partial [Amniculicola lignicola CBS 123094]